MIKALIASLEKSRNKYWNVSRSVAELLNILIKERQYKKVLEIGASNGYSGIFMAQALSETEGHLWTIESHKKERINLAKENFQKSGLDKFITLIEGHAPEAIPQSPKKFDLVFMDATKGEYHLYFEVLKTRINKGGMIIADNTESHKKELQKYFKMLAQNKDFETYHLNLGTGLTVSLYKTRD